MKKFLSLVLALVMVTSLFTMAGTASAADFTDDDDITYKEAIDVISAIGVVDGYSDGTFKPTNTLTRGAAAKIITNMILGPSGASNLSASVAPFPDVPANHTFAAAIAYCSQNKIINGYGDGRFVPDGTLTGYAFMKMLLGALGYDGSIEGFTGANWSINVAKIADGIGLTNDVADTFSGNSAVDRQTACLFAFNTIKSDLVEYDSRITANVGGVEVAIGGTNTAKSVTWDTQATSGSATNNNYNIVRDNIIQFGERYFTRLVRNSRGFDWNQSYAPGTDGIGYTSDGMGRPAVKWTFNGEKIGTYTEEPTLTYNGSVKITDVYNDLKLSTEANGWIYMNGILLDGKYSKDGDEITGGAIAVKRGNDTKLSDYSKAYEGAPDFNAKIGDGTIVEVFYNNKTNEVVISAQSVYGGKVSTVKAESAKKDAYVTIEGGNTHPEGDKFYKDGHNEYVTSDFSVDDVVAYTYSDRDREIVSMYKMESVEGSLSKYTVTKNLTLGDTTYKYAKEITFGDGMSEGQKSFSNGSNYIVYLDSNGYALWVEEAEFSADAYALVLRITGQEDNKNAQVYGWGWIDEYTDADGKIVAGHYGPLDDSEIGAWDGNRARMLFADGTTRTVNLDKAYVSYKDNNKDKEITNGFRAGQVVRFRVESDGTYKLSTAKNGKSTAEYTDFKISDKKAFSGTPVGDSTAVGNIEFDNSTLFVINDNGSYKLYTGKRNAPQVEGADAFVYFTDNGGDKTAKVVFITSAETVIGSSKDITFIAKESASKLIDQTDGDSYYMYNAVVAGEIKVIYVNAEQEDRTINGEAVSSELDKVVNEETKEKNKPGKLVDNLVLNQVSYDSDDLLVFGSFNGTPAPKTVQGLKKVSGNDIRVNTWTGEDNTGRGGLLTIADGTKVFYVNTDGDIEAIEISDIATDPNVQVHYTTDSDGDIDNLFIVEVKR